MQSAHAMQPSSTSHADGPQCHLAAWCLPNITLLHGACPEPRCQTSGNNTQVRMLCRTVDHIRTNYEEIRRGGDFPAAALTRPDIPLALPAPEQAPGAGAAQPAGASSGQVDFASIWRTYEEHRCAPSLVHVSAFSLCKCCCLHKGSISSLLAEHASPCCVLVEQACHCHYAAVA